MASSAESPKCCATSAKRALSVSETLLSPRMISVMELKNALSLSRPPAKLQVLCQSLPPCLKITHSSFSRWRS